jgi:hypothetical protein
MTFSEYYPFYLSKHQNPHNRLFHLAGQVATWTYFALVLFFALVAGVSLWWLLLTPFIVYPFAVPGHLIHEGNKPAFLSSNPIYAKMADVKMCYEMLRGRI